MPTLADYLRPTGWKIFDASPDSCFQKNSTMLIGRNPQGDSCQVVWFDDDCLVYIADLPVITGADGGVVLGGPVDVIFPGNQPAPRLVEITYVDGGLRGSMIDDIGQTPNGGTFAATTNPDPTADHRRR